MRHRWSGDADPVRADIEFFIALRNKIEHRYAREQQALTAAVGGRSQALLLGLGSSLATRLRFPVFIGSFTDEGERTLRRLRSQLPASLRTFSTEGFRALLGTAPRDEVTGDRVGPPPLGATPPWRRSRPPAEQAVEANTVRSA